jgi:hypothetical protein
VLLRRRLPVLVAAVALLASMLVFSAPAFADKGGVSHDGSCGLSKESVHNEIENPSSPGASEAGHFPFGDCKGKG